MRSKPTWKSKAKQLLNAATGASNGSKKDARPAKSNKPAEDHTRTPQPQLSEAEVEKLRAFLDKSDKPFGIVTEPVSKKRKRESSAPSTFLTQEDLWEDRLTVRYEVRPREKWESLRKYRKFTGESISVLGTRKSEESQNFEETLKGGESNRVRGSDEVPGKLTILACSQLGPRASRQASAF